MAKEKRTRIQGTLHKRIPQRAATTPTDIYYSTKSKSKVLVQRIKRLMVDEKHARVTLHGMGAVILPAINTAQAAKEAMHHHVDLKFTTSTVHLIDDIEPDDMNKDIETQQRANSAIHIEIIAKPTLEDLQRNTQAMVKHPSRNRKKRVL